MPGRKKSSTAKAKSEQREVLQAAKHRKLIIGSGDLVVGSAARDTALRAGGQEPRGATRKRDISPTAGKHKKKQKLSKGSTRASQGTKTHKRVKGRAMK
jgi:hypothetical protein